jgi:hypothetical protein
MEVQMTLALWILGAQLASAAPTVGDNAGEAALRSRLLATFDGHFFPERLDTPPGHGLHNQAEGFSCLTGLVMDLKANWHIFSPDEKSEMTGILAPWKKDLLDPMVSKRPEAQEGEAPPMPGTCWGNQMSNQKSSTHFSVQWDSAINDETAQDFSDSLEFSWDAEMDDLGWRDPDGVSQYQMLVMVESGNYAGAYTTADHCSGIGYIPYIVTYAGSFSSVNWYKVMACH